MFDCIYLFEVNTKTISSNMLKISVFSRVRSTSENADIGIDRKNEDFLFIFSVTGKTYLLS